MALARLTCVPQLWSSGPACAILLVTELALELSSMAQYPDVTELVSKQGEKILLSVYRSYLSILSDMALFVVALAIVVALNAAFISVTDKLRWLAILPILLLLNIFRTYFNQVSHFELHRITSYTGRLALSYGMPTVKFIDIRALNVQQDILGRIFDYGDVRLGTAGVNGWEIDMHGVRAPRELARLVNDMRNWNFDHRSHEEQTVAMASTNNE